MYKIEKKWYKFIAQVKITCVTMKSQWFWKKGVEGHKHANNSFGGEALRILWQLYNRYLNTTFIFN
jgi:hypothetical protein